ncbi:unnamed protein product [Rotaria sordida]|uniref:Uncharacterized protein n=1 Tax=Rotaria sordida TaxID=392033 RepID=A0A815NZR0_9BILA|nr:unnamed protein product [Rotaria sordida]CAF3947415.1 unnamed protein product [Rotaria sordida]
MTELIQILKTEIKENHDHDKVPSRPCIHNAAEHGVTSSPSEYRVVINSLSHYPTITEQYKASIPSKQVSPEVHECDFDYLHKLMVHKNNTRRINILTIYHLTDSSFNREVLCIR